MQRLIVDVESVAAFRQARGGREPDPVAAAQYALLGGADAVAIALREDRREAQERDVRVLRQTVHREFSLSIPATPEMLKLALDVRPETVRLTPEGAMPGTSGGVDVQTRFGPIGELVRVLDDGDVRTLLSIRPEIEQVKAAHRVGAFGVELHTARFAEGGPTRDDELERIRDAARLGATLGLVVGVGHGLDYPDVRELARLDDVAEFHVGHAIVSRAIGCGMERAVAEMRALL